MKCKACGHEITKPFSFTDQFGSQWWGCDHCKSQTSNNKYEPDKYGKKYVEDLIEAEGGSCDIAFQNHVHNADMIERNWPGLPGRTFLDVGTGHGASQLVMRSRGWATNGFDIKEEGRPPGTVVADKFHSNLFYNRFDAVLCREVIEHCDSPTDLILHLYRATKPGGVCEITTPRPVESLDWRVYQPYHLVIFSVEWFESFLKSANFEIEEKDIWELGQRYLLRKH